MCIHSPSAGSTRKRSECVSTQRNITPITPNSRYFGRSSRIRSLATIMKTPCVTGAVESAGILHPRRVRVYRRMPVIWRDAYVQEDAVRARNRVVGDADGRRAGRPKRRRGRIEGDGRRSTEDDSVFRPGNGVFLRPGVQPGLAMARLEEQELYAHD